MVEEEATTTTTTSRQRRGPKGRRKRSNSMSARQANFFVHADFNGLKALLNGKMTIGFGFKRSKSVTLVNDEIEFDMSMEQVLAELTGGSEPIEPPQQQPLVLEPPDSDGRGGDNE